MGIQVRGPRANREALYFAPQRASWEQSIRSFLERSPAAEGCDLVQLERLAALQHFLEVDIADLHLPPEQRCSEDEPLGLEGRAVFFQGGKELKENFSQKVAAEIRQRLRQSPAGKTAESEAGYNVLVRGATSLLSQSGLANLERACDARVVVGGGDQELIFELKPCENEAAWDFLLCCEKMNFENFMVAGPDGSNQFFQCGTGSRIFRSTQIRLTVEPKYPPVSIEVLELRSEMDLLDELYQPIAWEPVQDGRENFQQNWCEVLLGVGRRAASVGPGSRPRASRCAEPPGPATGFQSQLHQSGEGLGRLALSSFAILLGESAADVPRARALRGGAAALRSGPGAAGAAKRIAKRAEGGVQSQDHPCSKAFDAFLACVRRYPESYENKCRTEAGKCGSLSETGDLR
eukprot:g33351.t1